MRAKTMPQKPTRKKVKMNLTPAYVSSTLSMVTRNLINMVAVIAFSGAVLFGVPFVLRTLDLRQLCANLIRRDRGSSRAKSGCLEAAPAKLINFSPTRYSKAAVSPNRALIV
jgi:hypothetical protein